MTTPSPASPRQTPATGAAEPPPVKTRKQLGKDNEAVFGEEKGIGNSHKHALSCCDDDECSLLLVDQSPSRAKEAPATPPSRPPPQQQPTTSLKLGVCLLYGTISVATSLAYKVNHRVDARKLVAASSMEV